MLRHGDRKQVSHLTLSAAGPVRRPVCSGGRQNPDDADQAQYASAKHNFGNRAVRQLTRARPAVRDVGHEDITVDDREQRHRARNANLDQQEPLVRRGEIDVGRTQDKPGVGNAAQLEVRRREMTPS